MELYQLRTFITVATEQNLTRAAEKLFTSQPAVSTQIRALEDELGVRLFDRTPKGMLLTDAGQRLMEHARRVVAATNDFKMEAEGLRGAVSGQLVLGLNNRPEMLRLLAVLHRLTASYPKLSYDIVCGSSGVILQGLEEGSISIGFFEGPSASNKIASHHLTDVELRLIAPIAWKSELGAPDWKRMESKPWIFMSPMCSYFRTIERFCSEQGLKLNARFRVNEELTAFRFVAEGLGMSLVAAHQVEVSEYRDRIFVLPHFQASVPLSIGYQAARRDDPVIVAVRDAVLAVWQQGLTEVKTTTVDAGNAPKNRRSSPMLPLKERRR